MHFVAREDVDFLASLPDEQHDQVLDARSDLDEPLDPNVVELSDPSRDAAIDALGGQ